MLYHINKIKDRVEYILREYPETRDCDKLLWLAYLCVFHQLRSKLGSETYLAFKKMMLEEATPPMESVRRVRQKLQEGGKYVGTKRKEKMAEADKMRDWARHGE